MSEKTLTPEVRKWAEILSVHACTYDLYEGTATDATNTRVVYISSDIVRGIHAALREEAGPAWRVILKTSGRTWGQAYYRLFARQVKRVNKSPLESLPVESFLEHLCALFACNGWGVVEFDLSRTFDAGIVRIRLHNSMVVDALDHLRERVDYLIAGMLAGFFSEVAGSELDCIEVASPLTGARCTEFLLSGRNRLERIRARLEEDATTESDDLVERIRESYAA